RRRFERFGAKSCLPAQTLATALRSLDRTEEALQVLEEAIGLRPDDAELQLFAARMFAEASSDHWERGRQLLEQSREKTPRAEWLRVAAHIEWNRGHLANALSLLRQVLQLQPLDALTHQSVAELLEATEGVSAALDHLRSAVDRFPYHRHLLTCWVAWLRAEPAEIAEPAIRRLIEMAPTRAWAVLELGKLLLREGRLEEAGQCADRVVQLDPGWSNGHLLRGQIHESCNRLAEARAAYREAIRLSVDNQQAIHGLLQCCDTVARRAEALQFIRRELVRQVVSGEALFAFREAACSVLEPEEVLGVLKEALEARPDLWESWSACIRQLAGMGELEEALALAQEATRRFPLLARLWMDLADVLRLCNDSDGELSAVQSAYRIAPSWLQTSVRMSEVHRRRGERDEAVKWLKTALRREPRNVVPHVELAEILWEGGHWDEALEKIERAIELEPEYGWAWDCLCRWAAQTKQTDRPKRLARRLVEERPGQASLWLTLARVVGTDDLDESLAALDKATSIKPQFVEAYDERARLLAEAGRFKEAMATCQPRSVWPDQIPAELIGRHAWIQWRLGDRDSAVARLRHALDVDPNF
ncbi:MAG TPA: tetratricopeptide repeat protein, partial [Planctomycetaceae bacterium]|nr:tetratricopeptide repeat protein [Planctomycetaceae bacterium]